MSNALFLDRDGIINHDAGYTHRIEDFIFTESIFELCLSFEQMGFLIFVVTNQAGIARGYYSEKDFIVLSKWMSRQFLIKGVHITKTYYCPFHPDAIIGRYKKNSPDRKPNPGMILRARDEFSVDLSRSVLIGDKEHDIQAGKTAGVGLNIIIGIENHCVLADLCFNSVKEALAARIWEM